MTQNRHNFKLYI